MDDVWDDNEDHHAKVEWRRLNEEFGNQGYLQGVEDGKEVTLQQGFDEGMAMGMRAGFQVGKMEAWLATLPWIQPDSLKTDVDSVLKQCTRDALFTREHFEAYAKDALHPRLQHVHEKIQQLQDQVIEENPLLSTDFKNSLESKSSQPVEATLEKLQV
jgi:hypothetical protein